MLEQLPRGGPEVGLLVRRLGGHDRDILGRLFLHDVHGIVECDYTDHPVVAVDNGQGKEVVFRKLLGHLFLVGEGAHRDDVGCHQGLDRDILVLCQHQVLGRNQTQDPVETREDVAGVDRLLVDAGLADLLEGLLHRHVRGEGDVLRGHDRACGVLRELQDLVDLAPSVRGDMHEDPAHDVCGHLLDDIRRIIDVQFVQDLLELRIREALDQELLVVGVHLDERVGRQCLGKQAEHDGKLIFRKLVENHSDVRRVHGDQYILYGRVLLVLDQYLQCIFYTYVMLCHDKILPDSVSWTSIIADSGCAELKSA